MMMKYIAILIASIACLCAPNLARADDGYDESEMDPAMIRILGFIEGSSNCLGVKAEGLEKISLCLGCNRSIAIDKAVASIEVTCREDLVMSRTRFLRLTGLIGSDWSIDAAAMKRASILKRTTAALAQQFVEQAFRDDAVQLVSAKGRAVLLDSAAIARPIDVFDVKVTRSQSEGGRFPDLIVINPEYVALLDAED